MFRYPCYEAAMDMRPVHTPALVAWKRDKRVQRRAKAAAKKASYLLILCVSIVYSSLLSFLKSVCLFHVILTFKTNLSCMYVSISENYVYLYRHSGSLCLCLARLRLSSLLLSLSLGLACLQQLQWIKGLPAAGPGLPADAAGQALRLAKGKTINWRIYGSLSNASASRCQHI